MLADELNRQDTYLNQHDLIHIPVHPDRNSLFSSVCEAGHLAMTHDELRKKVVEYISLSKNDFKQFLAPEPGDTLEYETFVGEELQEMAESGSWVGFETIMALSRHLGAVIVFTSGGTTDKDAVRTDSFYFGEERPEKHIHIVWASMGFYDPAVSVSDKDVKESDILVGQRHSRSSMQVIRELSEQESRVDVDEGITRRHPSHVCECQMSCECRRWVKKYIFPENTPAPFESVTPFSEKLPTESQYGPLLVKRKKKKTSPPLKPQLLSASMKFRLPPI